MDLDIPIPNLPPYPDKWNHLTEIDLSHRLSHEPCVDLQQLGLACNRYYSRDDGLNSPYNRALFPRKDILVRRSAAEILVRANKALKPLGLELLILDGLRILSEQLALWRFFLNSVHKTYPNCSDEFVTQYARRYCYDPSDFSETDPSTWPVHMTGGSVDLTLVKLGDRTPVDMGGSFDDVTEISRTNYYEIQNDEVHSSIIINRRILYNTMTGAGFTNYPEEWWHYDFGTALWAASFLIQNQNVRAFYGLPENYR